MSWRIAESLKQLRKQIDALYPNRSKASDGAIGDAAHASRSSDHNPWVNDGKQGIVTAIDITHDPKTGVDCNKLAEVLFASKDARIKYLIWNKKITKQDKSGWKAYSGKNAHQHHLHISVNSDRKLYDSTTEWNLSGLKKIDAGINPTKKPNEQGKESESSNSSTSKPRQITSAGDETSEQVTETQAGASNSEPAATQTADVIQNIGTPETKAIEAASNLPDTHVEENQKTGFLAKLGVIVATITAFLNGLPEMFRNSFSFEGLANVLHALFQGVYNLRYLIIGGLIVWFVVRKIESVYIRHAQIQANTDPARGNVVVVQTEAKKSWTDSLMFWR